MWSVAALTVIRRILGSGCSSSSSSSSSPSASSLFTTSHPTPRYPYLFYWGGVRWGSSPPHSPLFFFPPPPPPSGPRSMYSRRRGSCCCSTSSAVFIFGVAVIPSDPRSTLLRVRGHAAVAQLLCYLRRHLLRHLHLRRLHLLRHPKSSVVTSSSSSRRCLHLSSPDATSSFLR